MTSEPDWGMELVTVIGCLFAIMMGGTLLVRDPSVWHLTPLFIGALVVVLHADITDKIPELGYSILGFYGGLILLLSVVIVDALVGPAALDALISNNTIVIGILTIVLVTNYVLSITLEFPDRVQSG